MEYKRIIAIFIEKPGAQTDAYILNGFSPAAICLVMTSSSSNDGIFFGRGISLMKYESLTSNPDGGN